VKSLLIEYLACARCQGPLTADADSADEIVEGNLKCSRCGTAYPVVDGVPQLIDDPELAASSTSRLYSDIWEAYDSDHGGQSRHPTRGYEAPARSHLDLLRLASGWEIVAPGIGIDAGCGSGRGVVDLAARHPDLHIVGVDLSEGPLQSAGRAAALPNAHLIRGNLMAPPLAPERFDFAYSFGVLHHTPDPRRAFRLLVERLRPGGQITVFLYKDFSDIPAKRFLLHQVNRLRRLTLRVPPGTLRAVSRLAAPFVFLFLTLPARMLRRVGLDRYARHIPYGTFPDARRISSSLEDRFGAPYEFRFSADELEQWAKEERLEESRVVDCLSWGFSGLVLAGRRSDAGSHHT
jgi:SAM-dependent methyltransferase